MRLLLTRNLAEEQLCRISEDITLEFGYTVRPLDAIKHNSRYIVWPTPDNNLVFLSDYPQALGA
jgi:hypothetical protein